MLPDPLSEHRGGYAEHDADDDIGERGDHLSLLAEPLGFQHPRGEGGVSADERGAGQQGRLLAQGQAAEKAQQCGAADVHGQRAERKRPRHPAGHRTIDHETQHRTDAADEHDPGPDQDRRGGGARHRRTRTRRTKAVAR